MFGDLPVLDIRTRLTQIFCYHKPAISDYYDYKCIKCGYVSDEPLSGFKLQHLWWLITGRMPKKPL